MTFVITQNCCKDTSCVDACPVDCIRPAGNPGESTAAEMLYIDPQACIDCGACQDACPVDAIFHEDELPPELARFQEINARYFERNPLTMQIRPDSPPHPAVEPGSLRIAVVGTGAAGGYVANELARVSGLEVDLFERLPTPFGLVRAGVAPDHQNTKLIEDLFAAAFNSHGFGCHLNVGVGRDITHQELLAHHHVVIYTVGASQSRDLGIPGENLVGSHPAADFVGWYNGHPDYADQSFDLSGERAVIIGNGNVALDVARVLLTEPDQLAKTDIAQHALEQLSSSKIEEVVIVARRGPRDSAFTLGEFLGLGHLPDVDIVVDSCDLGPQPDDDVETEMALEVAREFAQRVPRRGRKRIVFRFSASPAEVLGGTRATGIRITQPDGRSELIHSGLILRSIGYRGIPVDGLPFDDAMGVVPNESGRVVDGNGQPLTGVYVSGWIKRGPRGVIGTNRSCAAETLAKMWEDFDAGILNRRVAGRDALIKLLVDRDTQPVRWQGWKAIEAAERERGGEQSRPRVKFVNITDMLDIAKQAAAVG